MRSPTTAFVLLSAFLLSAASASASNPFPGCRGSAMYKVTFFNGLTPRRFGKLIPPTGLVYSPMLAVSHSNRVSLFTIRGFASKPVEEIAETGNNKPLAKAARMLKRRGYVRSVVSASGPTMPGKSTTLRIRVDCKRPFATAISMIAPSPDWIVQVNNVNLYDSRRRRFVRVRSGRLIAYDAGTDSGREFTDPGDASLDKPTMPAKNIAPLVEDETDRFRGRRVGFYVLRRMW